jgi:dCMP deaminase
VTYNYESNELMVGDQLMQQTQNQTASRPSWDQIWMEMARVIAKRSVDPRHQVGTVIVTSDNTQVLSIGYNGDQRGGPNTVESNEPGCSGFLHSEINALIKCDYNTHKKKVMYLTLSPCRQCAKAIINGNISEVVYLEDYRDTTGLDILQQSDVQVRKYSIIDR